MQYCCVFFFILIEIIHDRNDADRIILAAFKSAPNRHIALCKQTHWQQQATENNFWYHNNSDGM